MFILTIWTTWQYQPQIDLHYIQTKHDPCEHTKWLGSPSLRVFYTGPFHSSSVHEGCTIDDLLIWLRLRTPVWL